MLSVKYERAMFDGQVREVLSEPICLGIAERYQMTILAFGTDRDNVHSLVQPVPTYSVRVETPESGDRYPAHPKTYASFRTAAIRAVPGARFFAA